MIKQLHRFSDGKTVYVNMDLVLLIEPTAYGTHIVMPNASVYVKETPSEVVS